MAPPTAPCRTAAPAARRTRPGRGPLDRIVRAAATAAFSGALLLSPRSGRADGQRTPAPPAAPWPVPPAAPAGVPISFEARDPDDTYTLSFGGTFCATPCSFLLPEGPQKVHVVGQDRFDIDIVHARPGQVRVQRPWTGMLIAGVTLMTIGTTMMIGGNSALFGAVHGNGTNGLAMVFVFGWTLGPITHLVGIGLMGGGLAKLSGANTVKPVEVGFAPTPGGAAGRLRFAF